MRDLLEWRWLPRWLLVFAFALGAAHAAHAQPAFDPRQMSGIPRPVTDLPDRAVSVRLIRGDLANNIANHPVELHVDGRVQTATTDENGRAQFDDLPPGATLRARAVVGSETLTSEEFPAPARGGVRLILVATDPEKAAKEAGQGAAPPVAGQVVLGGESRIVIENDEETVRVFYVLDIVNMAKTPVTLSRPFSFEVPAGALGTTVLQGSSPKAQAKGPVVVVEGPFPPGTTAVEVGYSLPTSGGSVEITQRFPAAVERVIVMAEKAGDAQLTSASILQQQEMPVRGMTYIIGFGQSLPADQPLVISLTGLPHHSLYPRWIALLLVLAIVVFGIRAARQAPEPGQQAQKRKRLAARREKLFQELVSLEQAHQAGRIDAVRYASRREELVAALEHVYGELDHDGGSPEPADRTGLAA
jgi:hypothetical protein